ncbi:hypothetical protein BJX62DRAFT_144832 [Aspergillus germanicus]
MAEPSKSCSACGWTIEQQEQCSYSSHVKLFHGASKRGVWSIGSDIILKERPDEGPKNETKTLRFFPNYPTIPAPKDLHDWVDSDKRYFVLSERIHGQTLEQTWPSLSESQKIDIADQVVEVRSQATISHIHIHTIRDGSACYPGLLFSDREPLGREGLTSVGKIVLREDVRVNGCGCSDFLFALDLDSSLVNSRRGLKLPLAEESTRSALRGRGCTYYTWGTQQHPL